MRGTLLQARPIGLQASAEPAALTRRAFGGKTAPRSKRRPLSAVFALLLACCVLHATAQAASACATAASEPTTQSATHPAPELTAQCAFGGATPLRYASRLTDGSYLKAFEAADGLLEIAAPEGELLYWLYLCFAETPASWEVQKPTDKGWETVKAPTEGFAHALVHVDGLSRARIAVSDGALRLSEVRLFGEGELPGDVQAWENPPDEVDLLVLAAHPDDEFIFFGGLIPWGVAQGKTVLAAYMTCQDGVRRAELLNGLWAAGVRYYPVIGTFRDRYTRSLDTLYDCWGQEEAEYFVMSLIRRYRPWVMVTHGTDGEYGHAAHKACAQIAQKMFDHAAELLYLPQLTNRYGVWQPAKLYLHMEKENAVVMDWSADAGGRSAIEAALDAFSRHVSQQHFHVQCRPGDLYDCSRFGLARTTVGYDGEGGDLFEHIPPDEQGRKGSN